MNDGRNRLVLPDTFVVSEDKGLVLYDCSTGRPAELNAPERRDGADRVEEISGIKNLVAIEEISGAVHLIGTRLGDGIDNRARSASILGGVVGG